MGRLNIIHIMVMLALPAGCTHESFILGGSDHGIDIFPDTVDTVVPDMIPPDIPDVPTECADWDGDGVCDSVDRCPGHDDRLDADGDGVPDGCDACRVGDDHRDADGDGIPDACDCDHAGIVCDPNAICMETGTLPACVCLPGYEGDGFSCTDIDECARGTAGCDLNATCTNTPGSFFCTCNEGYVGDGFTCTPVSGGTTGTVRRVDGTWIPIQYVLCGSGSPGACTPRLAKHSCTSLGQKIVSHASDGTTEVYSLGATTSCNWSVSYFTIDTSMPSTSCLVGMSNLDWSSCCTHTMWHGNTLAFGAVSEIFGYVNMRNSGYVSTYPNVDGHNWGCVDLTTAADNHTGCTAQYVACTR